MSTSTSLQLPVNSLKKSAFNGIARVPPVVGGDDISSDDTLSSSSDEERDPISSNNNSSGKTATKKDLLDLSLRGKDVGGEGNWIDAAKKDKESSALMSDIAIAQQAQKHQRNAERELLQKRKASLWDATLDSGRVKKVKSVNKNPDSAASNENYFQKVHDRRVNSDLPRAEIMQQEQAEREEAQYAKNESKFARDKKIEFGARGRFGGGRSFRGRSFGGGRGRGFGSRGGMRSGNGQNGRYYSNK